MAVGIENDNSDLLLVVGVLAFGGAVVTICVTVALLEGLAFGGLLIMSGVSTGSWVVSRSGSVSERRELTAATTAALEIVQDIFFPEETIVKFGGDLMLGQPSGQDLVDINKISEIKSAHGVVGFLIDKSIDIILNELNAVDSGVETAAAIQSESMFVYRIGVDQSKLLEVVTPTYDVGKLLDQIDSTKQTWNLDDGD